MKYYWWFRKICLPSIYTTWRGEVPCWPHAQGSQAGCQEAWSCTPGGACPHCWLGRCDLARRCVAAWSYDGTPCTWVIGTGHPLTVTGQVLPTITAQHNITCIGDFNNFGQTWPQFWPASCSISSSWWHSDCTHLQLEGEGLQQGHLRWANYQLYCSWKHSMKIYLLIYPFIANCMYLQINIKWLTLTKQFDSYSAFLFKQTETNLNLENMHENKDI